MARGWIRRGCLFVVVALMGSLVPLTALSVLAPRVASATSPVVPSGTRQLIAGGDVGNDSGPVAGVSAHFSTDIADMAADSSGNLYVADRGNAEIRKVTSPLDGTAEVSTVGVPSGWFTSSCSSDCSTLGPNALQIGTDGELYVVTGSGAHNPGTYSLYSGPGKLLKIDPSSGSVTTLATGFYDPMGVAISGSSVFVTDIADGYEGPHARISTVPIAGGGTPTNYFDESHGYWQNEPGGTLPPLLEAAQGKLFMRVGSGGSCSDDIAVIDATNPAAAEVDECTNANIAAMAMDPTGKWIAVSDNHTFAGVPVAAAMQGTTWMTAGAPNGFRALYSEGMDAMAIDKQENLF